MMICLMPINMTTYNIKEKIQMSNVDEFCIHCDIEKKFLGDIIQFTFSKYCDFTMFGYNNRSGEFWAKKLKKNMYLLNFTLKVQDNGYYSSKILIHPLIGEKMEYTKLYNIIINMIKLYQPGFCYDNFE